MMLLLNMEGVKSRQLDFSCDRLQMGHCSCLNDLYTCVVTSKQTSRQTSKQTNPKYVQRGKGLVVNCLLVQPG